MAVFSCATWMPVGNVGGPLARNLGLILHHAVADGSLHDWFDNPASGVSAHFWVSRDGRIEQYVDTDWQAWHAMQLNDSYIGVETEGCTVEPFDEPMPDPMVEALVDLYAEGNRRHGWPHALAEGDGQPGFGTHKMAVATACPCDTRANMRQLILDRALGQPAAWPEPPPPVSPAAPPWPGRYFEYPPGVQGADVMQWQEQMGFRGWPIDVDGAYGPLSKQVCVDFQTEKNLAVDGIVGPDTWAAAWAAPIT
jgi:peptidoglycan hydrolase-like protein with peptidoglycan-binding domain